MPDSVVNSVLLVLKMLYLSDFRDLQNDVNALIVLGQEFTANPYVSVSYSLDFLTLIHLSVVD